MLSTKWWAFYLDLNILTLLMLDMEYSSFGGQYHACWCSNSQIARASADIVLAQ